jgi:hypothetical protein
VLSDVLYSAAAPVLDSQEGKLISEIFGTLSKAENVPVIPDEVVGGHSGLGLNLSMPGIKPDPDADTLFGPVDGGSAGGFGLVNNPDGWTASAAQQSRALEMTAEFMQSEKVVQPLS